MTETELLSTITRYTEACDDLGTGLFEQTAQQTDERMEKATALWSTITAEVKRLHAEAAKSERRAITYGDIVHNQILAMRAALVDFELKGRTAGLAWIVNTLEGPGHLPDIESARAEGGAQAMFDREMAEHEAFRAAHPAP